MNLGHLRQLDRASRFRIEREEGTDLKSGYYLARH